MSEFSVSQRINAVIEVTINASNREEAIEKAQKEFNKGIFKSNISYIDGQKEIIGVTNMDLWNLDIE